jgi:hypothetical protein
LRQDLTALNSTGQTAISWKSLFTPTRTAAPTVTVGASKSVAASFSRLPRKLQALSERNGQVSAFHHTAYSTI